MFTASPASSRDLPVSKLSADVVVAGGGVAGVCFAIAAARQGSSVVLIQDRPVLGGNASSEVRLWMNGATSHGNNNNRWARESGIVNEILTHNVYRNPGGNAHIVDTVFLDMVLAEPKITLLLNTAAYAVEKSGPDTISGVKAFNSQNQTFYDISGSMFCDASGDGVVGFLAGAAFRVGAEEKAEFGEGFAPDEKFGHLLGHSIYFYSKDIGRPVDFVAPSYALKDIEKVIPRYRNFKVSEDGPELWWIEFGGRLDTIFQTEDIKWELWRIIYGVWDYFKNSGKFPESRNLTLEWVGTIPGKRESRRFEGDYMLRQQDVIGQVSRPDDVAFGGWSLDLHPADGVYSELRPSTHYQSRGPYPVPFRTMYSRNIRNLFLAGRIVSCSHVSFGSLRNMASLGYCGQAAGVAASLCVQKGLLPADLSSGPGLDLLQGTLLKGGQHIRGRSHQASDDLARSARVESSSEYEISEFPADAEWLPLKTDAAQMLPLAAGPVPGASFHVRAKADTTLHVRFRISDRPENFTVEETLSTASFALQANEERWITISCDQPLGEARYGYYILDKNEHVEVQCTTVRVTGVLTVFYGYTQSDGDYADAIRAGEMHEVDSFEVWTPRRRPDGKNFALKLSSPIRPYTTEQLLNGVYRPTSTVNAWVAAIADRHPTVTLRWDRPQTLARVVIDWDPDWEHPMESVIRWHADRAMPFTVCDFLLKGKDGQVVYRETGNYLARTEIVLDEKLVTSELTLEILKVNGACPAAVFGISAYAEGR